MFLLIVFEAKRKTLKMHWRKYMMNLWLRRFNKHRVHYGRFLCRNYNKGPSERKKVANRARVAARKAAASARAAGRILGLEDVAAPLAAAWVERSRHYAEEAKRAHSEHVQAFHILYMKELTRPDGPAPPQCVVHWRHWCTDQGKDLKDPPYEIQCMQTTMIGDTQNVARAACACADKVPVEIVPKEARWLFGWERGGASRCYKRAARRKTQLGRRLRAAQLDDDAQAMIDHALGRYERCMALWNRSEVR